jgi:hypothetical protein
MIPKVETGFGYDHAQRKNLTSLREAQWATLVMTLDRFADFPPLTMSRAIRRVASASL